MNLDDYDEEELVEINNLSICKKRYKIGYENHIFHKLKVRELNKNIKEVQIKIVEQFDDYLRENYHISLDNFKKEEIKENIGFNSKE